MAQRKARISRPTSAPAADIERLPQEPINYRTPPPSVHDQVQEPESDSSDMAFYTQYRTNIFLLKTDFMLNDSPITVLQLQGRSGCSLEPALQLGGNLRNIFLSAIQRDLDNVLRNCSDSHVGNYYCEREPGSHYSILFEVVFTSEASLKKFLELLEQKSIETSLVAKVTQRISDKNSQDVRLSATLELLLAVTHPKSARKVVPVNSKNYHSCMQAYLSSSMFSFSELLQAGASTPITELGVLMSDLHSVVDWFELGLKFNIPETELEKIRSEHFKVDDRKREVLILCMKRNELTWLGVVTALHDMKEITLASKIAGKYGIQLTVDTSTDQLERIPRDLETINEDETPNVEEEEMMALQRMKEKELELQKQKEEKRDLELQAKHQQEVLSTSKDLIAKLERDKEELMKQQSRQVKLSESLQESNFQLQSDIREKDQELKEERDKYAKLQEDHYKTKEILREKTAQVENLQATMEVFRHSLERKNVTTSLQTKEKFLVDSSNRVDEKVLEDEEQQDKVTDYSDKKTDCSPEASVKASVRFISPLNIHTTIGTENNAYFAIDMGNTCTKSDSEPLKVSAQLRNLSNSSPKDAQVTRNDDQYEVLYTPCVAGKHTLEILIDETLINTQHFTVYPNPCKPLVPTKTIPMLEAPLETDVDSAGKLWIAQSGCVSVVDSSTGILRPVIQQPEIVSLSIAEDDSVFVVAGQHLLKADSSGKIIKRITVQEKGTRRWEYVSPQLVRAYRDRVYMCVSDFSQIWVYDSNLDRKVGTINLHRHGQQMESSLSTQIEIAFDKSKDVMYVLRSGDKKIQVLSTKGEYKDSLYDRDNKLSNPIKLCVAGGYVYLIDICEGRIAQNARTVVLGTSGEYLNTIRQRDGTNPYSITAGRDGHIYLCCQSPLTGDQEDKVIVY